MSRPRSLNIFDSVVVNVLYLFGKDVKKLAEKYNVSERTIYRYVKLN